MQSRPPTPLKAAEMSWRLPANARCAQDPLPEKALVRLLRDSHESSELARVQTSEEARDVQCGLGMFSVHRADPYSTVPAACPVLLRCGRITRPGSSPSCCMPSHAGHSTRVCSRWLLQAFLLPASCSLGDGPHLLKVAHQDSEASAVGLLCCKHVAKDLKALPPFFELDMKDLAGAKDKLQEILAREPTLSTLDVAEATSKVRITLHSADGRRTRNFLPGLGFDSLKLWPASCFPVSVRLELLQRFEPDGELALEAVNVRRPQITARCCKMLQAAASCAEAEALLCFWILSACMQCFQVHRKPCEWRADPASERTCHRRPAHFALADYL